MIYAGLPAPMPAHKPLQMPEQTLLESSSWTQTSTHLYGFEIGGVRVQLSGARDSKVVFGQSLEPFRADTEAFDINIELDWVSRLSPPEKAKAFDSDTTWCLYDSSGEFQFDLRSGPGVQPHKRLLINRKFSRGSLLMSEEFFAGACYQPDPFGYPLDELLIMHRLTQEKAIELHGTGIVRANGDANLFVGHSGAGKSTTTRLWTDVEDVEVLSDDRIIVRRDETAVGIPCEAGGSESEHGVLRLRENCASLSSHSAQDDKQIPRFARNDKKMRMYGTPWHGEAMFASPNSAPLSRIFVLEHGHGNVITPLPPSQAVAELFARSFVPFHRHEYVDSALVFLEELANSVPVYRYSFEPDQRAVDKIRQFRD